tara:strand:+ start:2591 stop:3763 length:1173 start_codon:yes stop_codon:yes gene_type:complete
MRKSIAVLGSTGSIGDSTLKVVDANPDIFSINLLAAESNTDLIYEQCKSYSPKYVYLKDKLSSKDLKAKLNSNNSKISVINEIDFLQVISSSEVEIVVAGIVGIAGLETVYRAASSGKTILLANKESYVVAGELLNKLALKNNSIIFPIDSEHSAIHQCLSGIPDPRKSVKRVTLTGSGGPFLNKDLKHFHKITPEEATNHPVWKMGKKISVDSATMMNKGLEVIEAKWLFELDPGQIDILIHPEGIVHSLVEFEDSSVIAQMSVPDMKIPIAYGLGFPKRINSFSESLNLQEIGQLTFSKPDLIKFPSISLAKEALNLGGTASALLNASNEEAVKAFLNKRISFNQITEIISFVMDTIQTKTVKELACVFEADTQGRESAINRLQQLNT